MNNFDELSRQQKHLAAALRLEPIPVWRLVEQANDDGYCGPNGESMVRPRIKTLIRLRIARMQFDETNGRRCLARGERWREFMLSSAGYQVTDEQVRYQEVSALFSDCGSEPPPPENDSNVLPFRKK